VELSDLYNILCIITPSDTKDDLQILIYALEELVEQYKEQKDERKKIEMQLPEIPALAVTPRDAFYAATEAVPIEQAVGRTIAEFVMVYPPGIPIFIPGEIISEENIRYAIRNKEAGLPVQGPEDAELKTLRVIKEDSL